MRLSFTSHPSDNEVNKEEIEVYASDPKVGKYYFSALSSRNTGSYRQYRKYYTNNEAGTNYRLIYRGNCSRVSTELGGQGTVKIAYFNFGQTELHYKFGEKTCFLEVDGELPPNGTLSKIDGNAFHYIVQVEGQEKTIILNLVLTYYTDENTSEAKIGPRKLTIQRTSQEVKGGKSGLKSTIEPRMKKIKKIYTAQKKRNPRNKTTRKKRRTHRKNKSSLV